MNSLERSPKPYDSRHLKPPEHFRNSLALSTAGDASLFRGGSGQGLSEPVMEFPAVLRAFLKAAPRNAGANVGFFFVATPLKHAWDLG